MKMAPVVLAVDPWLHRISRGRLSLVGLAGLPSLRLVTTGRRSGLPRTNDLLYTPLGDDYVLVGSGWGRPAHPAWTLNLRAEPNAAVVIRGRRIPVTAREVTGAERGEVWGRALRNWPGYEMEERLAGREFRVFVLVSSETRQVERRQGR